MRKSLLAAVAVLGTLGHAIAAGAVDAQMTTKEAASSTGGQQGQGGAQQPRATQLRSDCPSSTTAGEVGSSAQAVKRAGEESGPCPPAGGSGAGAKPGQ